MNYVQELLEEQKELFTEEMRFAEGEELEQTKQRMADVVDALNKLNIAVVSQQRELFYNFITWYNTKSFVKKPKDGLITTTIIEEYLKL